ncbi:hypothetical protein N7513_001154 [Penicillium frequentans]|nr:hypothetical protein N7513_001154 [Penicillium glabrum]
MASPRSMNNWGRSPGLDFDLHTRRGKIPILDTSQTATIIGYQAKSATKALMADLLGGPEEQIPQLELTGNGYDDATPPGHLTPSLAVLRLELDQSAYTILHCIDEP